MTKEEKDLLLKDICTRLPYGVKVEIKLPNSKKKIFESHAGELKEISIYGGTLVNSKGIEYRSLYLDVKPYLRPMSSMTEEEYEELWRICDFRVSSDDYDVFYRYGIQIIQEINNNKGNHQNRELDFSDYEDLIDWLNAHHFDYRGLIEKGLALEAPEEMYKNI